MAFQSQWRYLDRPIVARRGQIGGQASTMVQFDKSLFEAIENFILNTQRIGRHAPAAMDAMARAGALTHLGQAQKRSLGPLDPQQRRPELAWQIPVRRISGRYFFGWKVQRVKSGLYRMYNDSREAYYIEYGIHVSGRRVRRPILKISLWKTLEFLRTTSISHRVWGSLAMPPPGKRVGKGFIWKIQSPTMESKAFVGLLGQQVPQLRRSVIDRLAP